MFVHLGAETIISHKELIAILHWKAASAGASKEFIKRARELGQLADLSDGDPKALVITAARVFLSPVSPSALKKRATLPR